MTYQTEKHLTVSGTQPYLMLNNQGNLFYISLEKPQHILGRDPNAADLVVPQDWDFVSRVQAVLRQQGMDYEIYDGDGKKPSSNRLYINHTLINATKGYLLTNGIELHIGQHPNQLIQLIYFNPATSPTESQLLNTPTQRSISLKQKSVLIGRDSNANLYLDAPMISRRHAIIDTDAQGRYILHDHSTNGVFVNGQQVVGKAVLVDGAKIRIGPITLVLRGDNLQVLDLGTHIRLEAHNLVTETQGKRRIDDLSFAIEPGQFVALVGGSGAGKSTLMRSLLGIEKTTSGVVYLNGEDLQKNFNLYRTQIGYVPQEDIIHRELTVVEVLTYAAQLRLPPDHNLQQSVEQALVAIQMTHRRHALISDLSGGQRKRVSIGAELLSNPKLFFLDEPTSGLDPGLDKQMMQLLKDLAHQDSRTIILVTHATANITECDRVLFLGLGGKLCYFGTPQAALDFFQVTDFADIYIKLQQAEEIDKYVYEFRQSPYYQKYITEQLSSSIKQSSKLIPPKPKAISFWQQWLLLTKRSGQLILRDRVNLALALFTAPIGISLITLALKNKTPFVLENGSDSHTNQLAFGLALRVLFVFTCSGLWVGFSSSAQEIVKESAIYFRERLVNLGLLAYLGAKVTVLAGLALVQTLLMVLVILIGFKSPQPALISWNLGLFITSFLTLCASFSMGLLISTIVKNSSQASSSLPLLLLPQIIFSGVLFDIGSSASKFVSWLMISRWSVRAYATLLNVNALIPEPTQLPNGYIVPQVFKPQHIYDPTWSNLSLNWQILLLHTLVYLILTFGLQKRKDIF